MIKNKKQKYSPKRQFGNLGEDFACDFLLKLGYKIIFRNYYKKVGEIDIIAKKNEVLHFIEVKSVSRETKENEKFKNYYQYNDIYRPEDNISKSKMLHMKRTIEIFISEKKLFHNEIQVDVITVIFKKGIKIPTINFIENVII